MAHAFSCWLPMPCVGFIYRRLQCCFEVNFVSLRNKAHCNGIILDALKQWRAEKARWGTDLDTRLRLAIKLVRPLVGIKFHEMRKRWYYGKATVRKARLEENIIIDFDGFDGVIDGTIETRSIE